ncbi:MAG: CsbD family protein [Marmoricola sp.]|nr:CsbD family protein [Marmoricola sp.]
MGLDDKFENKLDDLHGRGKEAAGAVTGDDSLKAEGEADQKKAAVKDKVDGFRDKIKEKVDDIL